MKIRPAVIYDLPAILEIYNWAVLNTTATAEYEPNTLEMRRAWYDSHAGDGLPILVAENERAQVIGWSSLSKFHARYGYRFSVEDSVYVHHEWWGRGVGKLLVAPLIDSARQLGKHLIIANIDAGNEASLRLHRSSGFVPVGTLNEVIYKFDRWLSTMLLQLRLE